MIFSKHKKNISKNILNILKIRKNFSNDDIFLLMFSWKSSPRQTVFIDTQI